MQESIKKPRSFSSVDISIKCVIVGDLQARKNELLYSYVDPAERSLENYIPWIVDNYGKKIQINNRTISLTMWDTSGQEDLSALRQLSYKNVDVIFILFNVFDKTSFENALYKWYAEVSERSEIMIIFLGNCDKPAEMEKDIWVPDAKKIFAEKGLIYLECPNLSPDIITKALTDSIAIYIDRMDHKIKNKKKCVLI